MKYIQPDPEEKQILEDYEKVSSSRLKIWKKEKTISSICEEYIK